MKKIVFILLFLAIAAAAYMYWQRAKVVDVVVGVRGPVVDAVYATGSVEPSVMIPIAPRTPGRLMALMADEGDRVTKDQVLAQLEDADLVKSVSELQSKLDLTEKEFQRQESLIKAGAVSKQSFDEASSNRDAARAAMQKVQAEMSFLQLKSPEDAQVIRRDGEVGEMIATNQPVFWLSCCAPLRVSAEVDEEDIADIKSGLPVLISADAFPGKVFKGTVQAITPKGDAIARSYRVRITLATDAEGLMPGMTAESNIIVAERKNALLLPASAVDKDMVWLVQDGLARKTKVVIGVRSKESVEIVSGLKENDLVILDPAMDLEDGQKVRSKKIDWKR